MPVMQRQMASADLQRPPLLRISPMVTNTDANHYRLHTYFKCLDFLSILKPAIGPDSKNKGIEQVRHLRPLRFH